MDVSIETLSTLERRLTVSVPADRLEGEVRDRLRELSRSVQMKGFRRGKVPAKVVEQRFGAQVRNEALGEVVRNSFNEAVEQEKLRPASAPNIETRGAAENGELRYTATFEVIPDFGKIDVSTLAVKRVVASVDDGDIDQMIDTLRAQRRSFETVTRGAQANDMVMVETFAIAGDLRVPAENSEIGGTLLGSGMMHPAIEEALAGMTVDEEKTVAVSFAADWRVPELAGKDAQVTVKVTRVAEPTLPALDKAFIESFGVRGGDLAAFRNEVRSNLERELKGALMASLRTEVIDKLVAAHSNVEMPARLVDAEARSLAAQAEKQAAEQGRKGVTVAPDAMKAAAQRRVAAGLLLSEIARQERMVLDGKRLNETMGLIASTYEDPQQVLELYRSDEKLMAGLRTRVMEDQVVEWIADHADVTELPASFSDVMRSGQQSA
jgi:trigger factor